MKQTVTQTRLLPMSMGLKQASIVLALIAGLTAASVPMAYAQSAYKSAHLGSEAAKRRDYPEAISHYEQALNKSPNDQMVKNNLAVLYANYAMSLQDEQDY